MNPEADRLYQLLPALYRIRDAQRGGPLKALCGVIAEEIAVLRENLDQLYDDQFIETCADWAAPYIGDLIGYQTIHGVTVRTVSARAEVANTIAYRRRKGTATVLEQLARDVTGWNARAVEFFQWLATSQYMNHVRRTHRATVDLRDREALERRHTAFNTLAHTIDVRSIETQKGRFNIPNIGLFLWRLEAFSLTQSPAFGIDQRRYLFNPLGCDMQLFTRPETESDISHLAEPFNVPEPIRRHVLHQNLDRYYGEQRTLHISADNLADTGSGDIMVCDLSDNGTGWAHMPGNGDKIAVDPVRGRLAFPPDTLPENLRVRFHYGFSTAMGGGEYERRESFVLSGGATSVTQGQSLQNALSESSGGGIVQIDDSGRYEETISIKVDEDAGLELRAANEHRPALILSDDLRIALEPGAELTLNGLLIAGGRLSVSAGKGASDKPPVLRLRHCTLVPGLALSASGDPVSPAQPSLAIHAPAATVEIDHCIVGALRAGRGVRVKISDSIVDATAPHHVAFAAGKDNSAGAVLTVTNTTVIGRVHTARLELASNVIFMAHAADSGRWSHPVVSDQNQQGCVRFSFAPLNATLPHRHRCQPDLAVEQAILNADQPKGSLNAAQKRAITQATLARVKPAFTTLRYGRPGYGQLGSYCPEEIRVGAEDESEMGAFHDVFAPQRESNLRIRLQEYLRFGLEAGVFYAT